MADTRPTTYALVIFNDPTRQPHSESRVRYLITQQRGGDSPRTIAEATGEHSGHEIVEALRAVTTTSFHVPGWDALAGTIEGAGEAAPVIARLGGGERPALEFQMSDAKQFPPRLPGRPG